MQEERGLARKGDHRIVEVIGDLLGVIAQSIESFLLNDFGPYKSARFFLNDLLCFWQGQYFRDLFPRVFLRLDDFEVSLINPNLVGKGSV